MIHGLSSAPWDGDELFGPSPDLRWRPEDKPSYATITTKTSTATATTGPPSPLRTTEIDRQHRTHILRRLEPNVTPNDIIQQLTYQLGIPEHELFEAVLRDPQDRRRFYCTYKTTHMKQHALGKGFTIGSTVIKPTDDTLDGYIPFPPFYIDIDTLNTLIRPYGELVSSSFVQTSHHTRVAGFKFTIKMKTGTVRPTTISYNACTMQIRYSDDLQTCTHCHRTGHLVAKCRTRIAAQIQRELRKKEHQAQIQHIYNEETTQLQIDAESNIRAAYIEHQRRLQVVADVYAADLADYQQRHVDLNTLRAWETAYTQYVTGEKEDFHITTAELTDEANAKRADLTTKYQKAGGHVDPTTNNQMEVDLDQITHTTLSVEISGEPDGDLIAAMRFDLHGMADMDLAALQALATQPPHTGEVAPTTPDALLHVMATVPQDTVIPIVDALAVTTPEVKMKPKVSKPRFKILTVAEWQSRTPKGLAANQCEHTVSFHTSTTDISRILYAALEETCGQISSQHPNPTDFVIQTSVADPTHRCIYLRHKAVRDIIANLILECHKANTMTLKSQIELGRNPAYISDTTEPS